MRRKIHRAPPLDPLPWKATIPSARADPGAAGAHPAAVFHFN
jgi:hypothetical protein